MHSWFWNKDQRWTTGVFLFSVAFSLLLIADVQLSGDGLWFWYAVLLRNGQHIYSDMHLPLQPLIVLETAIDIRWFGPGWLVSKIPAVLHALLFAFGLLLLARRSSATDRQRALMFGCAYFVSICSRIFRFDDYHVIADCCTVYALVILLALPTQRSLKRILLFSGLLGIITGLAFENRLNDGGALLVGVLISLVCFLRRSRISSVLVLAVTFSVTALLIVKATGDTLHMYAYYSIFHAADGKGGAGSVLHYPLMLPWNTLQYMRAPWWRKVVALAFGSCFLYAWKILPVLQGKRRRPSDLLAALAVFLLIVYGFSRFYFAFYTVLFIGAVSALGVFLIYGLGIYGFLRFVSQPLLANRESNPWDRRQVLFVIPMGQLVSIATSSGGNHGVLFSSLGIALLLLIVCSPIQVRRPLLRHSLAAFATLLFAYTVIYKTVEPYLWHSYKAPPLYQARQWYRHPVYGPMLIDRDLLSMMTTICSNVDQSHSKQLLSLPYPFPNYFCDVAPWHGYVQTFYDTSTKATIEQLMGELRSGSPEWIVYQQQPENLKVHEIIYNQNYPLPHRALDQFIMQKITDGSWSVVYRGRYGSSEEWSNEWFLIHTKP